MYFDNNAGIPMTDVILREYCNGAKLGNILNGGRDSLLGQIQINNLNDILKTMFGNMNIVYTSGGSEGNSTILSNYSGQHIVCSTVEHSSIIEVVKHMNVSWVRPTSTGHVPVDQILSEVRPNTGLVILQSINSETGAIQKLDELFARLPGRVAVHIDHVQGFMKYPKPLPGGRNMSIVISFHKVAGPVGFGALITNYKFRPLIGGTQNHGLRGGTYNIAGVYSSIKAINMYDYSKIIELRNHFDNCIAKYFTVIDYDNFMKMLAKNTIIQSNYIINISCVGCLPHTIFMCIGRGSVIFCNMLIKNKLVEKGITIGTGSACNATKIDGDDLGSMKSSDIPDEIKKGFLRISISCYNTRAEISKLVSTLSGII
jgi:cysteine desulfurase